VAHVVGEIEAGVVHPDRMLLDGREGQPLSIARREVQTRADVGTHPLHIEVAGTRAPLAGVEDRHGRYVNTSSEPLEAQERAVLRGELLVRLLPHPTGV
jgi:hypothetical protein